LDFLSESKSKSPLSKGNLEGLENQWVQHYLGSDKPTFGIKADVVKKFCRNLIQENNLSQDQMVELLNSLYHHATTFNEIDIAGRILNIKPQFCRNLDPNLLDNWLNYTHGWAENDILCQSNFTSDILLSNWSTWEKLLKQFNQSANINKRRASLVLLTKSLGQSDDSRFSKLAFQNVERLKSEKEILVTKAVSWVLRALIKHHPDEVETYLSQNHDILPKITYREVFSKATTGRKYINHSKNK
jgi:3-methyladenine DNA glycosylase AlkD